MSGEGARARTRGAIVAAAAEALAADPGASVASVADAAAVSRTTVHRHFPSRADLLRAVGGEVAARLTAAAGRARLDHGPAPEAIARLCREYFELEHALTVVFTGTVEVPDEIWSACAGDGPSLAEAVARGRAEGTLADDLDKQWMEYVLWSLLYSAWAYAREHDVPRQQALGLCVTSVRRALAAPSASASASS